MLNGGGKVAKASLPPFDLKGEKNEKATGIYVFYCVYHSDVAEWHRTCSRKYNTCF